MSKIVASIHRDRKRPFPIRIYNAAYNIIGSRPRMSLDPLLRKARKQNNLTDFGDESFIEPLSKLIWSINHEASLNPFGMYITKIRIVNILSNLLRAQYYFDKHPEILENELDPILVITGLQRTGTTMLHRLISSDPDTRALYSWEALNPAPFINAENDKRKRLKRAMQSENGLKFISKDFFAIHPVEHAAPEEEVLLIDTSFVSTVAEAILDVPTFSSWVENTDHTFAYQQLKRMLLLLQWQDRRKRWILKTPHHLEFLPYLFKVFPEAKLIQTHRIPEETIASFLSMIYHGRQIFSDDVTVESVRDHWYRKVFRMVELSRKFRSDHEERKVLDIYYQDLINSPLEQLDKIYEFADWELQEGLNNRFNSVLNKNKQHKYGIHRYDLKDYDLSVEDVRQKFSAYYKQFFNSVTLTT